MNRNIRTIRTIFLILILTAFSIPAYAAAKTALATPVPFVEGECTAAWNRVSNAGSYDLKITMKNTESGKTVSRTYSTALNRVDLSLFTAGNDVTFSVRAIPSGTGYRSSGWGSCQEEIEADEDSELTGFAGISGSRFYMEDENGSRMTGWKKCGGKWYYFNPAENGLALTGWADLNGQTYLFSEYGKMCTGWQAWNGKWYFLDPKEGTMYTGWRQVTPNNYYYFTEKATAEQPRGSLNEAVTTASCPDSRPPYPLAQTSSADPAAGTARSGSTDVRTADQWKANPDGSWSFIKNGNALRNSWEKIDGFWYYFNSNGIMLTGWQFINYRWYYLEPSANGKNGYKQGAMWANATTPDGYRVNADGCWVQNGVVVTTADTGGNGSSGAGSSASSGAGGSSSGSGSAAKQSAPITGCHITLNASDAADGKCRTVTVTGASHCTVRNVSCSKPREQWTPGETITITVELEAAAGYMFSGKTRYSCNSATLLSESGNSVSRTVKLGYITVMKLETPTAFYVTDSYEMKWAPPAYATRYKVVFEGGENGKVTKYVTEPQADLYEYGDADRELIRVTVSAMREEGSKCFLESDKVTISDPGTYKQTHTLNGSFERRDGRLRFLQEDGTYAAGWQYLAGSWYHFRSSGASDGPGWYQDSTGYWYYFDNAFRMVTGTVSDGGKSYVLNDGRRSDLPQGAWIQ